MLQCTCSTSACRVDDHVHSIHTLVRETHSSRIELLVTLVDDPVRIKAVQDIIPEGAAAQPEPVGGFVLSLRGDQSEARGDAIDQSEDEERAVLWPSYVRIRSMLLTKTRQPACACISNQLVSLDHAKLSARASIEVSRKQKVARSMCKLREVVTVHDMGHTASVYHRCTTSLPAPKLG